jgi:hypothetical protein
MDELHNASCRKQWHSKVIGLAYTTSPPPYTQ